MKKSLFLEILLLVPFLLVASARAEDELMPGYNACMEKATCTADAMECISAAYLHWDAILNANFKKAKASCGDYDKPEECTANLLKAQRAWIQYRDAMAQVILDADGGGSIARVSANSFFAKETKKQAQLLAPAE